jgi:cytochrome c
MRRIRGVGSVSALAVAASLLLARVHPFGNADLYGATAAQAPAAASIPPSVRALLSAKCGDCHSASTHAPVYARFAPISWLMERDIVEARKTMNLSRWDSYSADRQQTFEAKMVQQTKAHEMPLLQYRLIHWNARVTPADVQVLSQWAHGGSMSDSGQAAADGDPVRGAVVFEKRCTGCHALTQNHEGPRLQGIYGRTTGAVAGFPYSAELKKANITWNDQSLEKWLADPDAFLPGNNMDFLVSKAQERKDLVAYFRQSGGK